ncbi:hypothetical protein OHA27_03220 [Streptomyces sp. NBC_01619]|uniref:hypothetical protein n=1 Tax=Streptomyces sp. NBC_01619 TaxID=2975901 RepID=UPI00225B920B|nr:hypothetical protein [Streptomyces sp. NBC_01619]MCX4509328.1 hypothetical protein [Streptomyces sp. NBC_01619]
MSRTPQQLIEELRGLADVDWATVWNGPPYPGQGLDMWCAQFNWVPTAFERVLSVRTDAGGELAFPSSGNWAPVHAVTQEQWGAWAEAGADNPLVLERAAHVWPQYLTAACAVLGEPAWEGSWDSEDFPESLGGYRIPEPDERVADRSPYRLAYWMSASPEHPLTVLALTLGSGATQTAKPRGGLLNLKFYPRPLGSGRP